MMKSGAVKCHPQTEKIRKINPTCRCGACHYEESANNLHCMLRNVVEAGEVFARIIREQRS